LVDLRVPVCSLPVFPVGRIAAITAFALTAACPATLAGSS
jgi:hypothetical protein